MFVSSEEYNIALEMLEPVQEKAFSQSMGILLSKESGAADRDLREARILRKAGDSFGAKKKYLQSLKHNETMKKQLIKIEDDNNVWDILGTMYIMPMVMLRKETEYSIFYTPIGNMLSSTMTKDTAIGLIDACIAGVKKEMDSL